MTHTIVFVDRASLDATLRPPAFAHVWRDHDATAPGEMVERLAGATIAVTDSIAGLGSNMLIVAPGQRILGIHHSGHPERAALLRVDPGERRLDLGPQRVRYLLDHHRHAAASRQRLASSDRFARGEVSLMT